MARVPIGRSIPRARPTEDVAVPLPDEWDPIVEAPLVVGDLVVLAGRGHRPLDEDFRLLAAFDATSGRMVWTVDAPERAPWLGSSAPVLCPDGRIRVALWSLSGSITVVTVTEAGVVEPVETISALSTELLARWPLPDPPPPPFDALEMRLSARGKKGGNLLSIRLGREGRPFLARTDYRRDGATRWTEGEWLLGETTGVAACEELGPAGRRVIGRDRRTGEHLWSGRLDAERRGVLAVANGEVVFLDERDREKARDARAEVYRDELIRRERGLRWEDFAREHPLVEPVSITAVDAPTGTETWRWNLPGDVHAFLLAPHVAVAAISGSQAGVYVTERGGAGLGRHRLASPPDGVQPEQRLVAGAGPRLIAIDHTHVLWAEGGELVCAVLAEIERVVWRKDLPGECRAPVLGGSGDAYRCSITVADERIFLAEDGQLHIWRAREESSGK